ncbi:hypothetical protein DW938_06280, partial [Ruminococcus sp. AM43-6]
LFLLYFDCFVCVKFYYTGLVDRTKVSRTAIDTLNEKYGEMLFRTSISKSIEAAKSSENGIPLCLTGHKLGQEYDELAQEVFSRC